jgi:hypothetical protein
MATKYIVNNVTGQTINGDITINGNLNVTGTTNGNNTLTYRALLTQTGVISGTNITNFNSGLIIGETYTITTYVAGDDFSNIANVTSGVINETGCIFIATGSSPSNWENSSVLTSEGNLVVDVLENSLGYEMTWVNIDTGAYVGFPTTIGYKYNNFPRNNTSIITQQNLYGPPFYLDYVKYYAGTGSGTAKDDVIALSVWDLDGAEGLNGTLYYTPIEIKMVVDTDTTPVIINGAITYEFPFSYASVDLVCGTNYIESFVGDSTVVNNLDELVTELNTNEETSFLGTFSNSGKAGFILTMPTNLVNRFCSNGTLTFEIYSDN